MPNLPLDVWPDSLLGALREWLPTQRWFAGKSRPIHKVAVANSVSLGPAILGELKITFADSGEAESYFVPISSAHHHSAPAEAAIHSIAGCPTLFDAVYDPAFRQALFDLLGCQQAPKPFRTQQGKFFQEHFSAPALRPKSRVLPVEQSNTSLIYGDRLFVKFYRRAKPGENPDAEITRYLSEAARFRHVPAFGGEVRWGDAALALATELQPNGGDAWAAAERAFRAWLNDDAALGPWLQSVSLLGRRTGQMHLALADTKLHRGEWMGFDAEFMSRERIGRLQDGLAARASRLVDALAENPQTAAMAREFGVEDLARFVQVQAYAQVNENLEYAVRRTHGDYHLGQVLCTGDDFLIIDFEGEPSRSLEERRAKQPPIRDVAGMLRSFHYAAHAARAADGQASVARAETWASLCQAAFLHAWRETVQGTPIADERLLRYYLVEKALYEIDYELHNRPDWLHIPLRGLRMELPE